MTTGQLQLQQLQQLQIGFREGGDEGSISSQTIESGSDFGQLMLDNGSVGVEGLDNVIIYNNKKIITETSIDSIPVSVGQLSMPSAFSLDSADVLDNLPSSKAPQEAHLIPFLLAKGQYDEVERTVRVAIGNKDVNEGEGILQLVKMMAVQADMYKLMGLWPLALAVYVNM